jgi:hypothetical protein
MAPAASVAARPGPAPQAPPRASAARERERRREQDARDAALLSGLLVALSPDPLPQPPFEHTRCVGPGGSVPTAAARLGSAAASGARECAAHGCCRKPVLSFNPSGNANRTRIEEISGDDPGAAADGAGCDAGAGAPACARDGALVPATLAEAAALPPPLAGALFQQTQLLQVTAETLRYENGDSYTVRRPTQSGGMPLVAAGAHWKPYRPSLPLSRPGSWLISWAARCGLPSPPRPSPFKDRTEQNSYIMP